MCLICLTNFTLCVTVTCPALPVGTNINPNISDLAGSPIGTNYTYDCLDGYKPSDEGLFATCQSTGEWSLSSPTCVLSKYHSPMSLPF